MKKPRKRKPAPKGRKPAKAKVHTRPGMKLVATMDEVQALAATDEVVAACPAPAVRTRDEIVADALASMSEGVSIRKIAVAEKMAFSTLHEWLTVPELAGQYARAREAQAIWWVEKALAVASGTDEDQYDRAKAMVESLAGADENDKDRLLDNLLAGTIQRDKLHVDTLKWTASKFYPKQFGEKVDLTSGGESFASLVAASMKITTEAP